MPKATSGVSKFDSYFVLASVVRLNIHDAAFPLFFSEAVHKQDGLSFLHARRQVNQSTVSAY
jgi:hypothetical protein